MAVPVKLRDGGRWWTASRAVAGDALALALGSLTGIVVYLVVERLLRSPELAWWVSGLRRRRTPEPPAEELAA